MEHDVENGACGRLRRALEGALFHTVKQLRHAAESAGFQFVPTETVWEREHEAQFRVRPRNLPAMRVRAVRQQPWHPFHVTSVEIEH